MSEVELKQLRRFADDDLKKRMEPVTGVAAVKVGGGLEDEIDVAIDQQQLARAQHRHRRSHRRGSRTRTSTSPAAASTKAASAILVRTVNQFNNLDEMRELLIKVDSTVPIRLKDIATVTQGYKEREGIVRLGGHEAIELAIYKEGDANTVSVAKRSSKQVDEAEAIRCRQGAKLITIEDQSIFIQSCARRRAQFDALLGGVLAILIIFFFLADAWSTFIISLSLPVSLIATFFFMGQLRPVAST